MSNFTREQLHEYFSSSYTPEQVNRALQILAENGADIDPDGDEFSLDITEELEKIFTDVGAALDNQRKLGQVEESGIVETIASKFSQHSNPQLMAAMIRMLVEEAVVQGAALTQIKSQVLEQVLQQGDLAIAQSLLNRGKQTSEFVQALVNDRDRLNKMAEGYGVETVDIDAFLLEVQSNSNSVKNAVKAISPAPDKDFDIDAFLLEAGR